MFSFLKTESVNEFMSSMHFDEGGAFILQMPFRLHDFSQKAGFQMCFIHTVALVRLFVVESLKYAYGKKAEKLEC